MRTWRVAVAIAVTLACLPAAAVARAGAEKPSCASLVFHSDKADPAYGAVDLVVSPAGVIARLQSSQPSAAQLKSALRITVDDATGLDPDTPAVLGGYQILPDRIRFTSQFPPQPGLRYRATADFTGLIGAAAPASLTCKFSIPPAREEKPTTVREVYPTASVLPANLLRFYVWFSAPMEQGFARDHVVLLGPDGRPDPAAFFARSDTELWDPAMRRLTVLLDPGRIKQGVGPNVELGAPLRAGEHYTLLITAGMVDAHGALLRQTYSKRFVVAAAVRKAIDPQKWTIVAPAPGTRRPIVAIADAPLDQALLARTVRLLREDGSSVPGHVAIGRGETRWAFWPDAKWTPGVYRLEVDPSLEDVAGNTTWGPFDAEASDADWPPRDRPPIVRKVMIGGPGPASSGTGAP